jgi:hypothetical protein
MSQAEAVVHGVGIDAKTLRVLYRISFTSTTLPWKRDRLLHGRPLLPAEYRTTVKSVSQVKEVSRKLDISILGPPVFPYLYLPGGSAYAVLFWEMVSVNY